MALEMRTACERCDTALAASGEAFICGFECTFCARCSQELEHVCPNCEGELVRRPRRLAPSSDSIEALSLKRQQVVDQVATAQARRRDLRAQTDRIFIFLAALVALVASQLDNVDRNTDRLLIGVGVLLGAVPLILIYRAKTPWFRLDLSRITTSSLRDGELAVIREGEAVLENLEHHIGKARRRLVEAEIFCAIIAFYLIAVSLFAL